MKCVQASRTYGILIRAKFHFWQLAYKFREWQLLQSSPPCLQKNWLLSSCKQYRATIMQLERVCHNHPLHVCRRIGYFPIANEPTTCNYKEYAAIMKRCPRITILLTIAGLNNYKRRCKYLQEANMNMHDREERTVETYQMVFFIPGPDSRPLRISYSIDASFPYKHLHQYSNRLMQTQTEHRNLWYSTRITTF